ncbi:MAG TPA: citrate/2-methylcitrate synthase [Gemmatimonadales bacterium]|nr:citrate/2-methylcitrate synthase [Gemmatimonadales bacterium]
MTLAAGPAPVPQLDGVVATQSSICLLSAAENRLAYRGYDVRALAEQATSEETTFLLLAGRLPARSELTLFVRALRAAGKPSRRALKLVTGAPAGADAMAVLRTAVSALGLDPPRNGGAGGSAAAGIPAAAVALVAQVPTLVAALYRAGRGERPLSPRRGLGQAANFLYMLHGAQPAAALAHGFDVALTLRADNELNPSTFAARIAAATRADLYGCVTAALAALAGPRHGGHALAVYRVLEEVGTADRVDAVVAARLAASGSFPGFGHPVYAGEDPRTAPMRRAAQQACTAAGAETWFELARAVEERVHAATGRFANVDFYLAPLYRAAGIPPGLFTLVFAAARTPGWVAHALEQYQLEGLIRPRAAYVGPPQQEYRPLRRRA